MTLACLVLLHVLLSRCSARWFEQRYEAVGKGTNKKLDLTRLPTGAGRGQFLFPRNTVDRWRDFLSECKHRPDVHVRISDMTVEAHDDRINSQAVDGRRKKYNRHKSRKQGARDMRDVWYRRPALALSLSLSLSHYLCLSLSLSLYLSQSRGLPWFAQARNERQALGADPLCAATTTTHTCGMVLVCGIVCVHYLCDTTAATDCSTNIRCSLLAVTTSTDATILRLKSCGNTSAPPASFAFTQ